MNAHDAAVAFHHDVAGVGGGFSYECNSRVSTGGQWRIATDERADGFCSGSCLSISAAGENEPVVPVSFGEPLIGSGVQFPQISEVFDFLVGEKVNDLPLFRLRQRLQILQPGTLLWPG